MFFTAIDLKTDPITDYIARVSDYQYNARLFYRELFQDIFHKRNQLECPECRKKVTIDIDLLPPNILANRILEMERLSQTQPQSQTKILPPPPCLPAPRRNSSTHLISKPPAPAPSEVQTSLPITSFAISSVNTTPVKLPVFSAPTCSLAPSPGQRQTDIPGNPSTNPFIDLIDATPYYAKVCKAKEVGSLAGAMTSLGVGGDQKTNLLTTTDDQSLIESLPVPVVPPPRPPVQQPGPALPDRNKMKQWQLSPRALIEPPRPSEPSSSSPVYKAVYQYKATQTDELSLTKGELYQVTEKCLDGWFKGKHINTGNIGVFPGNHVKELQPKQSKKHKRKEMVSVGVKEMNLIDLSDEEQKAAKTQSDSESKPETDAERLEKLKKIRETLRAAQHKQQLQQSHKSAGAAGQSKSKAEKYRLVSRHVGGCFISDCRCVVPFPASSEYEIDLQLGDVVSLVKRREDGWCKGTLHR